MRQKIKQRNEMHEFYLTRNIQFCTSKSKIGEKKSGGSGSGAYSEA